MLTKILLLMTFTLPYGCACHAEIPNVQPMISDTATESEPIVKLMRKDCKSPEKTGWEIEGLKGRVKELKDEAINYEYGPRKKELKRKIIFDSSGNYVKYEDKEFFRSEDFFTKRPTPTFSFDNNCLVLERRGLYPDWGMTRTTYSYTAAGVLKEETIFDSQDRLLWMSLSELDGNGRPIEKKKKVQVHPEHFNPKRFDVYRETKSFFKYDDKGNMVEQVDFDFEGKLYATYRRAYNDANKLIRLTRLDHKGRLIDQSIYKFDESGRLAEEFKYFSASYSGVDELIPGKVDSGFGLFQQGSRIIYEYDKNDNWSKRTEYSLDKGEEMSSETFRTLVYF